MQVAKDLLQIRLANDNNILTTHVNEHPKLIFDAFVNCVSSLYFV